MVAETYKSCPIVSGVFKEGGREYVNICLKSGQNKKVRWYGGKTEAKPKIVKASAFDLEPEKVSPNAKEFLGFGSKGYITIFKGDTEATHDWFAYNGRYAKPFGWYFPSEKEFTTLPVNIEPIKITWEEVSQDNELLSESKLKDIIDTKLYGENSSNYLGKIGEKIDKIMTISYAKDILNDYGGNTHFYVMEDESGNVCTWSTTSKRLYVGETYKVIGTIKDLKKYKNIKQTVLTRCKIYEDI